MFAKFFSILLIAIIGLLITLIIAWPEELSEKLLPWLFIGVMCIYMVGSWYLGFFLSTQKPPMVLIIIGSIVLILTFLSGLYIGNRT